MSDWWFLRHWPIIAARPRTSLRRQQFVSQGVDCSLIRAADLFLMSDGPFDACVRVHSPLSVIERAILSEPATRRAEAASDCSFHVMHPGARHETRKVPARHGYHAISHAPGPWLSGGSVPTGPPKI
jgi:hypothetical protein